ncbi:MAG: hypothetical protein M3Y59_01755 [Myxococcota bacterium]|nr:hypothetical protein [Myxococcota bacterium]
MRHLDEHSWKALNAGDRETEAYFAGHLAYPCDPCERFLQEQDSPALDGATDALLLARRAPLPSSGGLDELAFRRVLKPLRAGRIGRRWVGAAAGIAAAALLLVLLPGPAREEADLGGIKAAGAALEVSLSVVEQRPDGTLVPVASGQRVGRDSRLLVRYRASAPGQAALVLDRPGSAPQVLTRLGLTPGVHDLAAEGEPLALTLDDERGRISLRLVARSGGTPLEIGTLPAPFTEVRAGWAQGVILLQVEE